MSRKLRRIVAFLLIFIVLLAVSVLIISANKAKDHRPCSAVSISYNQGIKGFVPKENVLELLKLQLGGAPVGQPVEAFNLALLEKKLLSNRWIESTQLYFDNNQVLHIQITERMPVARIIDQNGTSSYLDTSGAAMPWVIEKSCNVPVFTNMPLQGKLPTAKKTIQTIIELANTILADSFWLAQVAQVEVLPTGQFEMYPVIGNHVVDLGNAANPSEKLQRLKAFYVAMVKNGSMEKYHRISVAFNNQVLAIKHLDSLTNLATIKVANDYQALINDNKSKAEMNAVVSGTGREWVVSPNKLPDIEAPKTAPPNRSPKAVMPKNSGLNK